MGRAIVVQIDRDDGNRTDSLPLAKGEKEDAQFRLVPLSWHALENLFHKTAGKGAEAGLGVTRTAGVQALQYGSGEEIAETAAEWHGPERLALPYNQRSTCLLPLLDKSRNVGRLMLTVSVQRHKNIKSRLL